MKAYFDHASTSPLAKEAQAAWLDAVEQFGNPSSFHSFGRQAKVLIEQARKGFAADLNASPSEIIFNSGATEGLNTAIRSAAKKRGRIFCSPIEHHAVLDTVKSLTEELQLEWVHISVDSKGVMDLDFLDELRKNDVVCCMSHNNELGNRNPIEFIARHCEEKEALLIVDSVQTAVVEALPLDSWKGVQALAISAHKFGGPKGTGMLFWRQGEKMHPVLHGGSQERGLRAGTQDVAGIAAMYAAWQANLSELRTRVLSIRERKSQLLQGIASMDGIGVNGTQAEGDHPGILNLRLPFEGRTSMLLFELDINGLAVSEGSACSSGSHQGSHVIRAIGKDEPGKANIRLSLSYQNTQEEVEFALAVLRKVLYSDARAHQSH